MTAEVCRANWLCWQFYRSYKIFSVRLYCANGGKTLFRVSRRGGFQGGDQAPLTVAATSQPLHGFFCQAFFHLETTHGRSGGCQGAPGPLTGCSNVATATRLFLPSFFFTWKLPTGVQGGVREHPDPLTGCSNVATATRLFLPSFFSPGNYPRAFRGLSGGTRPPDRLQQRRNRYTAFFAKLFFTWKKSVTGVRFAGRRADRRRKVCGAWASRFFRWGCAELRRK